MRRHRLGLLLLVLAVFCAACGVRVNPKLRQQAADAQLGRGGATVAAGAASGSEASKELAGATGGAAGSASAAGGATGAAGGATGGASKGQNALGSAAPAGGNGGATDVGVTGNSILLGNVSDLSGPVPGIFQGAVTGSLAYYNYVNSQGGVFGRQLKQTSGDSQTDCQGNQNAHNQLIGKVFAFVGSFNLYDDCGAQVFNQHKDVPDVAYALSKDAVNLPNNFSVDPIPPGGYATGMFQYYAGRLGDDVKAVGTIYPNIPSASSQQAGIRAAAEAVGWKVVYSRAVAATETNFTTDIVRMQQQGVKVVWLPAQNATNTATIVQEAQGQNWHPKFVLPVAYDSHFIDIVGGAAAAEGILGYQLYSMFFNPEDAQSIPEVALFQQWMQRTNANQAVDLFAMYGWAEAALFVQALKAAGPKATRAGVLAQLAKIHTWDTHGMTGVADPAGKKPTICYVLWQIHNGKYGRVDTPPGAYRCDGALHGP